MIEKDANNLSTIQGQAEFTIGELIDQVSRLSGHRCTGAMINNYERQGLLSLPDRSAGGVRKYKPADVYRVLEIKKWQAAGFSLAQILQLIQEGKLSEPVGNHHLSVPVALETRIIEAAEKIFPQKGYRETTIQEIVKEAGISTPTFYTCFNSKEDLFLALIDQISFIDVLEEINNTLETKMDVNRDELRATLLQVANAFLDAHKLKLDVILLLLSEGKRYPEVGVQYRQRLIIPVMALLEQYFSRLVDFGLMRGINPRLAAHAFYGIFLNFFYTRDVMGGDEYLHLPPWEETLAHQIDLFLNGVLTD